MVKGRTPPLSVGIEFGIGQSNNQINKQLDQSSLAFTLKCYHRQDIEDYLILFNNSFNDSIHISSLRDEGSAYCKACTQVVYAYIDVKIVANGMD
jgi:hypothetical protein